jgi:hypothetical protein
VSSSLISGRARLTHSGLWPDVWGAWANPMPVCRFRTVAQAFRSAGQAVGVGRVRENGLRGDHAPGTVNRMLASDQRLERP